jgi:SAM-dependent methyltransferase
MNYREWYKWWIDQAPTYFTDKVWVFSRPDLIDKLNIGKETKVLEIGFGYGRELFNFCRLSDRVAGVELTGWACKSVAEELDGRGASPFLKPYDGMNLPFKDNTLDVIYSCFVIQHMSKAHAETLIGEALRTLAPGGKILFEFFGDPAFTKEGEDVFSDGVDGKMYNNGYTIDEICGMLNKHNAKMYWCDYQKIDTNWGNHWVCFGGQ